MGFKSALVVMTESGKLKVVYWNNIPSPYMVERFNALARRDNLDFEAWFSRRTNPWRSWNVNEREWLFRSRYLPRFNTPFGAISLPVPLAFRRSPDVMVSLYAEPEFVLGWIAARLRRISTAFWVEVTFDHWVRRRTWKDRIKREMFSRVDGIITVASDGAEFSQRYGADSGAIHFARHAIDVDYFTSSVIAARTKRDELRRELGLNGTVFVYVGRLWNGKGLDYLLDAFAVLRRQRGESVSLILVGDGDDEARLRERCSQEGIEGVCFAGFVQKDNLPQYYAASDVFVFPTLGDPYGLVVDEAMASSLPIISTSAAGEICDRVSTGENGFVVRPANSAALLEAMDALADAPAMRAEMGRVSRSRIDGHTPDRWAEDFERAVNAIASSQQLPAGTRRAGKAAGG